MANSTITQQNAFPKYIGQTPNPGETNYITVNLDNYCDSNGTYAIATRGCIVFFNKTSIGYTILGFFEMDDITPPSITGTQMTVYTGGWYISGNIYKLL